MPRGCRETPEVEDGELVERAYDDAGNRAGLAVNAADQAETGGRTYDALGQLATRGTRTFAYDTLGRLRRTTDGGATVEYDYDPLGRLTAIRPVSGSTVPLQRFLYRDGLNPVAWQRATVAPASCTAGAQAMDNVLFLYASREHTPDVMYYDTCGDGTINATYRLLTDERGSVRSIVNVVTGVAVEQYLYDAWGNPRTGDLVPAGRPSDGVVRRPTLQPFGFTGGIWDGETGFWRLGARDYDPTIGRWTTRDPIGFDGGYNLYAYCDNDPVNCIDVTGLDWTDTGLHVFNTLDRWGVIALPGDSATVSRSVLLVRFGTEPALAGSTTAVPHTVPASGRRLDWSWRSLGARLRFADGPPRCLAPQSGRQLGPAWHPSSPTIDSCTTLTLCSATPEGPLGYCLWRRCRRGFTLLDGI